MGVSGSDFFSHGVGSTLLNSSGDLSVSSWSSDGVLWVDVEVVLGLWSEELSVVLLLDGLLLLENVLLLLFDEEGFSLVSHVLELKVDLSDLLIGKAVSWSVNQILDGSKLVDEDEIVVVSGVVDGIKIGVQKVLLKEVMSSLVNRQVEDSAGDLEQVLGNIVVVSLELLEIRLNEDVLLGLVHEGVDLSSLLIGDITIKEVELSQNINEVDLSDHVLAEEEDILILLVELSDQEGIRSLSSWGVARQSWVFSGRDGLLDLWGEESVSVVAHGLLIPSS